MLYGAGSAAKGGGLERKDREHQTLQRKPLKHVACASRGRGNQYMQCACRQTPVQCLTPLPLSTHTPSCPHTPCPAHASLPLPAHPCLHTHLQSPSQYNLPTSYTPLQSPVQSRTALTLPTTHYPHTLGTTRQEQSKKHGWRKLLRSCRATLDIFRSVEAGWSTTHTHPLLPTCPVPTNTPLSPRTNPSPCQYNHTPANETLTHPTPCPHTLHTSPPWPGHKPRCQPNTPTPAHTPLPTHHYPTPPAVPIRPYPANKPLPMTQHSLCNPPVVCW